MASKTNTKSTAGAATVSAFFHVGKSATTKKASDVFAGNNNTDNPYVLPTTPDPVISAFYAQLTEKERIAHAIAVDKLGTSYDVTRTHGFKKWEKKRNAQ